MTNVVDRYAQCAFSKLDDEHGLFVGELPEHLRFSREDFKHLWDQHPRDFQTIVMHGKAVKTPRWQQAYGVDYHYSGQINRALPVPQCLLPMLEYVQSHIDQRLNGVLLNFYDASLRHYIGKHRDSTKHMLAGAPIVTVSLGSERTFRVRRWRRAREFRDYPVTDGTVIVMPYATNAAFTHEVPHFAHNSGRRISVTFRAFE